MSAEVRIPGVSRWQTATVESESGAFARKRREREERDPASEAETSDAGAPVAHEAQASGLEALLAAARESLEQSPVAEPEPSPVEEPEPSPVVEPEFSPVEEPEPEPSPVAEPEPVVDDGPDLPPVVPAEPVPAPVVHEPVVHEPVVHEPVVAAGTVEEEPVTEPKAEPRITPERVRGIVAQVIKVVATIAGCCLITAALLIAVKANPHNGLVSLIRHVGQFFDLGVFSLSNPIKQVTGDHGPELTALLNYGIGSIVWFTIGGLLATLVKGKASSR